MVAVLSHGLTYTSSNPLLQDKNLERYRGMWIYSSLAYAPREREGAQKVPCLNF
jgi:hypothetical protein